MWTEGISSSQGKLIIWNGWKTEGGARLNGMHGKDAVDFAGRADAEKTELELSGLDPDALGFMRAGERKKVLERAGLDPAKYDF